MDYYLVILRTSPVALEIGQLIKSIDYEGNPNGWYLLKIKDKEYLFSGKEIRKL